MIGAFSIGHPFSEPRVAVGTEEKKDASMFEILLENRPHDVE